MPSAFQYLVFDDDLGSVALDQDAELRPERDDSAGYWLIGTLTRLFAARGMVASLRAPVHPGSVVIVAVPAASDVLAIRT